jgi:LysM repeat protein
MTPLAPGGPDILLPPTSGSGSRTTSSSSLPKSTRTTVAKATKSTPSRSTKSTVAKNTRSSKPKVSAPKTVRHLVKRGDTLGGLAAKYGTTVSAIQRANGIKGTMIYDGKSLTIPARKK